MANHLSEKEKEQLRDSIAISAMQTLMSSQEPLGPNGISLLAYAMADAMLIARAK